MSWDTRQGLLELKVDGERVPGTSPLVTEFQAAAGRTYQLLISDGSQWDDYGESFNVPFTLVTALK